MTPMQRLGTRVAMLAAVGIMLAGCSGGGTSPMAGGMTPAPGAGGGMEQPGAGGGGTPATATLPVTFPTTGTEKLLGLVRLEDSLTAPAGLTLGNLFSDPEVEAFNVVQFDDFEFSPVTVPDGIELNGIELSKASAAQDGRYATIAYRGILEHSMFLFQGGVYNRQMFDDQGRRTRRSPSFNAYDLSIGNPTEGNLVAGTWKGIAVGFEYPNAPETATIMWNTRREEQRIVQGNVEIGVTIPPGGSSAITAKFRDWTGGFFTYPDVILEATDMRYNSDGNRAGTFGSSITDNTDWSSIFVDGQFYGPAYQEAGGTFAFQLRSQRALIGGVYGAKKQAE